MPDPQKLIQHLEAENAKLRDRVITLEARCGHLMVDADRRERAALDTAESCEEHGRMLMHWQRLAEWHWAASGQQENARWSIISELQLLIRDDLRERTEPVPVDLLCQGLQRVIDAQRKVKRRAEEWPPLETFLHLGCTCSTVSTDGTTCQKAQAQQGRLLDDEGLPDFTGPQSRGEEKHG